MANYDISEAFEVIEDELISSMMRNLSRHRIDEVSQGIEWEQWQVLQLQALEEYRQRNQKNFPPRFNKLNGQIANALHTSYQSGVTSQERQILQAIQNGYQPPVSAFSGQTEITGEFFKTNDRKLNALVNATVSDMSKAEYSILRHTDDQYRQIIFNAQVYANTGAGTYEKAVDMATKDFLKAGINSIQYKNGSRHTIEEYSRMALQTAMKRAYLQGEGEKRKEFGIPTVILKKRTCACPKCLPFVGKVFIDDVWSSGSADGISPITGIKYPLLSQAIALGLYHPNCRDTHSTYYEGISTPPEDSTYTVEELDEIAEKYKAEQQQSYCENQADRYHRLSKYSLDSDNKRMYGARATAWDNKAEQYKKIVQSPDEFSKNYKPVIISQNNTRYVERQKTLITYKSENTVNDIYVSEGTVSIKRKKIQQIDSIISEVLNIMDISKRKNLPTFFIVNSDEMAISAIASYRPIENELFVDEQFAIYKKNFTLENYKKKNKDLTAIKEKIERLKMIVEHFACPNDNRSSFVHELFHWLDAQEYREKFGEITKENYQIFDSYVQKKAKKHLDKLQAEGHNIFVSDYAKEQYDKGMFDETYAEYRVYKILGGN